MTKYILDFVDNTNVKSHLLGGKADALSKLYSLDIRIPKTYVITTDAHREFLSENPKLSFSTFKQRNTENIQGCCQIREKIKNIRNLHRQKRIPINVNKSISELKDKLGDGLFSVRSSASCEDGHESAWAGQFDTYLNTPNKDITGRIVDCWSSIFSPGVYHYSTNNLKKDTEILMGVIIQEMVDADISGVCFTSNPINKNLNEMIIECCSGLGEVLVSGQIVPNAYILSKKKFSIINFRTGSQKKILHYGNASVTDYTNDNEKNTLSEKQLKDLHRMAKHLEEVFGGPQDFEWSFSKDKLYILQSRPISTL